MIISHKDLNTIAEIAATLKKEYQHHHSHAELADRFCIGERKLRSIFKEATGKTITNFLTEARIEKAKEFLLNTDDPIRKIAIDVGYEVRNLQKKFKLLTGMTPLEWKNNNRENRIAI